MHELNLVLQMDWVPAIFYTNGNATACATNNNATTLAHTHTTDRGTRCDGVARGSPVAHTYSRLW